MKQGSTISASLVHVIFYPDKTESKYSTIIALHGRGTDEYDLIPLVESLGLERALVISPRAPLPFRFGGGSAWYDLSQEGIPHHETFVSSLGLLRKFINEARSGYPIDRERMLLLGFSQGTVMAYAAGLMDPPSFRGVAALSGYIPHRSGLPLNLEKLDGFSAFISHGSYDPLIPVTLGRESAEILRKAGAVVTFREYPMGHEVREEAVRELAVWARNLLEMGIEPV